MFRFGGRTEKEREEMNGTKKKKGIIIAGVLLSAVLLAGIAVGVVFLVRKKRRG